MTRNKHDPKSPFAKHARDLMRELKVLCRGLTEKEREDIGINAVLMGICFAELSNPGTDTTRCMARIGTLQHGLRILIRKLLRRWKPTKEANKALRKQSLADLDRILKPQKKPEPAREQAPEPEPAHKPETCDNHACRRTDCPRHAAKWN